MSGFISPPIGAYEMQAATERVARVARDEGIKLHDAEAVTRHLASHNSTFFLVVGGHSHRLKDAQYVAPIRDALKALPDAGKAPLRGPATKADIEALAGAPYASLSPEKRLALARKAEGAARPERAPPPRVTAQDASRVIGRDVTKLPARERLAAAYAVKGGTKP